MVPPNDEKKKEPKKDDTGNAKIGQYNLGEEGDDFGTRIGEGHDDIEDEI